jgi:hypothetical protein
MRVRHHHTADTINESPSTSSGLGWAGLGWADINYTASCTRAVGAGQAIELNLVNPCMAPFFTHRVVSAYPTTPPAGPDRMALCPENDRAGHSPPSDCMNNTCTCLRPSSNPLWKVWMYLQGARGGGAHEGRGGDE